MTEENLTERVLHAANRIVRQVVNLPGPWLPRAGVTFGDRRRDLAI